MLEFNYILNEFNVYIILRSMITSINIAKIFINFYIILCFMYF